MKIIVGITGASGSIYGLRLIEVLKEAGHQIHVVITDSGQQVIKYECPEIYKKILDSVDKIYDVHDVGAAIASGVTDNLLIRAADVMLKEGRKLILVPRETPVHIGHLENMLKAAQIGAIIIPACPGFYHRPSSIMDLVDMLVGKICDRLGIKNDLFSRWTGDMDI